MIGRREGGSSSGQSGSHTLEKKLYLESSSLNDFLFFLLFYHYHYQKEGNSSGQSGSHTLDEIPYDLFNMVIHMIMSIDKMIVIIDMVIRLIFVIINVFFVINCIVLLMSKYSWPQRNYMHGDLDHHDNHDHH